MRRQRRVLGMAVACLPALVLLTFGAGCGGPTGSGPRVKEMLAQPSAADYVREAQTNWDGGRFQRARDLLVTGLQSRSSFRSMPELLYLLARTDRRLGRPDQAALGLRLLRRYYPHRWATLADREGLEEFLSARPEPASGPQPHDASTATVATSGDGPPGDVTVSNVFYETDIHQALADIAAQTGVPIATGENVRGLVTLELRDVSLEACLRRLTEPLGLAFRWRDGYWLVGRPDPSTPAAAPLTQTLHIRPRHMLVTDLLKRLPRIYEPYLRCDGTTGNALTLCAPAGMVDRFTRDLATLDRPPRQVVIEAMVVELRREAGTALGLDWEAIGAGATSTFNLAITNEDLDAALGVQYEKDGMSVFDEIFDLKTVLQALETRGDASILASPQVATLDGKQARIRVGSESYYSLLSGSVTYSYYTLQKIATGITLTITPHVSAASEVTTEIAIEVSDVRAAGKNDLPITSVREVESLARMDNGETLFIGGLTSQTENKTTRRVPLLGRIPLLGSLFGSESSRREDKEVVVMITPHILIHPDEYLALLR